MTKTETQTKAQPGFDRLAQLGNAHGLLQGATAMLRKIQAGAAQDSHPSVGAGLALVLSLIEQAQDEIKPQIPSNTQDKAYSQIFDGVLDEETLAETMHLMGVKPDAFSVSATLRSSGQATQVPVIPPLPPRVASPTPSFTFIEEPDVDTKAAKKRLKTATYHQRRTEYLRWRASQNKDLAIMSFFEWRARDFGPLGVQTAQMSESDVQDAIGVLMQEGYAAFSAAQTTPNTNPIPFEAWRELAAQGLI